ncbi:hypothetical protein PM082_014419 [Marasmius tenuissimus]|nr:hypothetical protein PM082_014419 [Marasmius tenuissimus]
MAIIRLLNDTLRLHWVSEEYKNPSSNVVSDTIDKASDEKEARAREQLEMLMKLADARLDAFEKQLNRMFLDSASVAKLSVPGKRALRCERSVRVDTGAGGAPEVEQAVDASLVLAKLEWMVF